MRDATIAIVAAIVGGVIVYWWTIGRFANGAAAPAPALPRAPTLTILPELRASLAESIARAANVAEMEVIP